MHSYSLFWLVDRERADWEARVAYFLLRDAEPLSPLLKRRQRIRGDRVSHCQHILVQALLVERSAQRFELLAGAEVEPREKLVVRRSAFSEARVVGFQVGARTLPKLEEHLRLPHILPPPNPINRPALRPSYFHRQILLQHLRPQQPFQNRRPSLPPHRPLLIAPRATHLHRPRIGRHVPAFLLQIFREPRAENSIVEPLNIGFWLIFRDVNSLENGCILLWVEIGELLVGLVQLEPGNWSLFDFHGRVDPADDDRIEISGVEHRRFEGHAVGAELPDFVGLGFGQVEGFFEGRYEASRVAAGVLEKDSVGVVKDDLFGVVFHGEL